MTVSLSKGGNVSLTKEAPGLTQIVVGLGWDPQTTGGQEFDLDASAILVGKDGKVLGDENFIFFNNLKTADGSVIHLGDNLTGGGDGDDEQIKVDLNLVSADCDRIVFPVTIYDAATRKQNFGQVKAAFIRIVNAADGTELTKYDLTEDSGNETAMIFGELYRHDTTDWKFRAIGQGHPSLEEIAAEYGVTVGAPAR